MRRAALLRVVLALAAMGSLQPAFAQARMHAPGSREVPNMGQVLKICFVYVSPIGKAGWTFQQDQGRLAIEKQFDDLVETRFVESVPEGPDSERVMRDFAGSGCGLIFATSFGYLEPALKVAKDFPGVRFEHAGGYKNAPNLATYDARWYEGRWLAGWLAGKTSKSGIAGYVAGFPVPEVIQGINAFTLGMRAANPKASVRVSWLDSWFDPPKEHEAALALIAAGADVLTNHSGSPAVPQTAEEKGVRVLAYQSDMREFAPHAQLAAVIQEWGPHFTSVADSVIGNRWTNKPYVGGMKDGTVQLGGVDPSLPAEVRTELDRLRLAIVSGKLLPFSAPLLDNRGKVRLDKGSLGAEAIAKMDWLVEGVSGSLPGSK